LTFFHISFLNKPKNLIKKNGNKNPTGVKSAKLAGLGLNFEQENEPELAEKSKVWAKPQNRLS